VKVEIVFRLTPDPGDGWLSFPLEYKEFRVQVETAQAADKGIPKDIPVRWILLTTK
jgi:hypothetical protein